MGDLKKASDDATEAIRLSPDSAEMWIGRGAIRAEMGDYAAAAKDFSEGIRRGSFEGRSYEGRARCRYELHDYEGAAADFSESLAREPRYRGPKDRRRFSRGVAYLWLKQYHSAIADFDKEIERATGAAKVTRYCARAEAFAGLSNFKRALDDYSAAIALAPEDDDLAGLHVERAKCYVLAADFESALADLSEAISRKPNDARLVFKRATVHERAGHYRDSIDDYTEAVRLDPNSPYSYNGRAWIWACCSDGAFRDGARAVESATRACELSRWRDAEPIHTLAAAFAEQGNFDEAVKWQTKALKMLDEPVDPRIAERLRLYRDKKPFRETVEMRNAR